MIRYGLPYQGSKNKLAQKIVSLLPPAGHFYDLFAGGCAVTHAALLSNKWGCVHFSDINDSVILFRDVLEGNIPDGSEWISREEFFRRKDTDPWVRLVWSFSNNQRNYLYGQEIEAYKKAVHEMIFAPTPNERRLKFREVCALMPDVWNTRLADHASTERSQHLLSTPPPLQNTSNQQFTKCRSFRQSTWRLEAMERMSRLEAGGPFLCGEYEMQVSDYRHIEILPDSVIYCDIPYQGTARYNGTPKFDYGEFYSWCERQTQPVFISEYSMPEDRFICIAEFARTSSFSATNNSLKRIEKIFVPKHQFNGEILF